MEIERDNLHSTLCFGNAYDMIITFQFFAFIAKVTRARSIYDITLEYITSETLRSALCFANAYEMIILHQVRALLEL